MRISGESKPTLSATQHQKKKKKKKNKTIHYSHIAADPKTEIVSSPTTKATQKSSEKHIKCFVESLRFASVLFD